MIKYIYTKRHDVSTILGFSGCKCDCANESWHGKLMVLAIQIQNLKQHYRWCEIFWKSEKRLVKFQTKQTTIWCRSKCQILSKTWTHMVSSSLLWPMDSLDRLMANGPVGMADLRPSSLGWASARQDNLKSLCSSHADYDWTSKKLGVPANPCEDK